MSPNMPEDIINENTGIENKMGELNSKPLENVGNVKKKQKPEECWNLFASTTLDIYDI